MFCLLPRTEMTRDSQSPGFPLWGQSRKPIAGPVPPKQSLAGTCRCTHGPHLDHNVQKFKPRHQVQGRALPDAHAGQRCTALQPLVVQHQLLPCAGPAQGFQAAPHIPSRARGPGRHPPLLACTGLTFSAPWSGVMVFSASDKSWLCLWQGEGQTRYRQTWDAVVSQAAHTRPAKPDGQALLSHCLHAQLAPMSGLGPGRNLQSAPSDCWLLLACENTDDLSGPGLRCGQLLIAF